MESKRSAPVSDERSRYSILKARREPPQLTWAAIFPPLLLSNALLVPALAALPALIRLLIVSGTIIQLMTYVVMPQATRIFRPWLYPDVAPRFLDGGKDLTW
jgi:antibiotic biosynthesis monooxygenase (ABM) superfamily enzyme